MYRVQSSKLAVLVGIALAAPCAARADHQHHAMSEHEDDEPRSQLSVSAAVQAASFSMTTFEGDYQGIIPAVGWSYGRFGAAASLGFYHITENGLSAYGIGDLMLGGHAGLVARGGVRGGVGVHAMLPTGLERRGLGMGHAMVMPSLWAAWHAERATVSATAGYARALASLGGDHDHGLIPLVDPMNMHEMTWSAEVDVALGRGLRAAGRALGGIPIGTGRQRAVAAGRLGWGNARVSTSLELQLGIAGDPFTVRGIVDTALRF